MLERRNLVEQIEDAKFIADGESTPGKLLQSWLDRFWLRPAYQNRLDFLRLWLAFIVGIREGRVSFIACALNGTLALYFQIQRGPATARLCAHP